MISLNILYPSTDTGRFDVDYYLQKHMPLSIREFGSALKGVSIEQGMNAGLPGSKPPFVMTAHLLFDSESAFAAAFEPIADLLVGDMINYTDITPVYQISEVKIYKG
jgi:uncharacterized protein (TIGR02118 family)